MVNEEFFLANICRLDELEKSVDIDARFLRASNAASK